MGHLPQDVKPPSRQSRLGASSTRVDVPISDEQRAAVDQALAYLGVELARHQVAGEPAVHALGERSARSLYWVVLTRGVDDLLIVEASDEQVAQRANAPTA
jgi:hypothetical protein